MRQAARILALCYAAVVTVGPIAHAADSGPVWAPALEAEHQAACAAGHDPATCPIASLSRTVVAAPRVPSNDPALEIRVPAHPESPAVRPSPVAGPHFATGPPLIATC